jgi:hypothetical protein
MAEARDQSPPLTCARDTPDSSNLANHAGFSGRYYFCEATPIIICFMCVRLCGVR